MSRRARQVMVLCLGLGYLAFVLGVGFWPTPVDEPVHDQITSTLNDLHTRGVPKALNYDFVEFTANIWLFVPIGAFVAALLPARLWWAALLTSAAFSGVIEIGQLLLRPARYASWYDLAANSTGALAGVTAVTIARLVLARAMRRS